MNEKERIQKVIESAGGRTNFSEMTGFSYSTINEWYNGRMTISCIKMIHKHFPWISLNWLIFGEGSSCISDDVVNVGEVLGELLTKSQTLQETIKKNINRIKSREIN